MNSSQNKSSKYVDQELIYKNNRHKLIQQNKQLHDQIFRLQSKVNIILSKKFAHQFQQNENDQKLMAKHKQQTKDQLSEISKLKRKIKLIKNSQKLQQKEDLRKSKDQVVFLKKQRQKYVSQKQALIRKRNLKEQPLNLNNLVVDQKKQLSTQFKEELRENAYLNSKIVKLNREILNFHKIKELSKTSVPRDQQNHLFELSTIESEIKKTNQQLRNIQKEWRPKVESLNSVYMSLKSIKQQKEKSILHVQKYMTNLQNRMTAMKDQMQILQDRARVSQVVISPVKRAEVLQKLQQERRQKQFFQKYRKRPSKELYQSSHFDATKLKSVEKKLDNSKITQRSPKQNIDNSFYITEAKQQEAKSEKNAWRNNQFKEQSLKATIFSAQNQFSAPIKQQPKQQNPSKAPLQIVQERPPKTFANANVGTTFYYNQNEDGQEVVK